MQVQCSTDAQQSVEFVRIGFARFKKMSIKSLQSILSLSNIKPILARQNWRIKDKLFEVNWSELFKAIDQCLCKRIDIESSGCSSVLTTIQASKFTRLAVINLSHNPITSIESLTFLDAPHLQFIFLQTNHITTGKSLGKIYFKHLEEFDLSGNKLKQISSLNRLKTNKLTKNFSIQLFNLGQNHHFHHWHEDEQVCKIEDISIMAKLEHFSDPKDFANGKKKYEMLRRQFQYLLEEANSEIKFMNALTQKKQLKSLQRKFGW